MIKIIISIVSLALAGAAFFMYTEPTYGKTQELQQVIEERNQALQKAGELKTLQDTLLSKFNAFDKGDLARLHKLLPDHVDNVRLILDLDRLAGTFGMAVQNVVISRSASEDAGKTVIGSLGSGKQNYDSLTLKFSTHGTYSNFIRFMESLESSLRIVDMVSLSISPDAQSASTASASGKAGTASRQAEYSYKYDVTLRTYWLR
ncbi:MAG: hypothetical protein Q7S01_02595 [bacterium]|nr:hypothetical protein [bacterium]